jgi:hypothetical protein
MGDMGSTGPTPTQAATRLGPADPETDGSCPQPSGHFDEAVQPGPFWRMFLAGLRQEQTFDPLQQAMPQLGASRSASRNQPEAYGTRRRARRTPTAADRRAGKISARREAHGRLFRRFRECHPPKLNIPLERSLPQGNYSEFRYAIRSAICCVSKRGQAIFFCCMLVSMRGPCSHSAETIETTE